MKTVDALEKEFEKLKPQVEKTLSEVRSKIAFMEQLETEYRALRNEIQGIKEYPEEWKGAEDHPWTHVKAIKAILKKLKGG